MAQEEILNELCNSTYICLKSFKKNGDPVQVPVWSVRDGDRLAFWTDTDSLKIRRMQRNPKVEVARCNSNGKQILGSFYAGTASIAEDEASAVSVRKLLKAKYGWQMSLVGLIGRLRPKPRSVVRIQFG